MGEIIVQINQRPRSARSDCFGGIARIFKIKLIGMAGAKNKIMVKLNAQSAHLSPSKVSTLF